MNSEGKVLAVLNTRIGSDRFPGKVLSMISPDWTITDQTIWRLQQAKSVGSIVMAITKNSRDDVLEDFAKQRDIPCHRGSEHNVVERMWDAAHKYGNGEPLIYRVMADQPYMDWEALDRSAALMLENTWDTLLPLAFSEDPVYGAGVAPWSYKAFQAIREHSALPDELEHVGMWLRRNIFQFNYGLIDLPHWCYRPYRFELDTPTDLKFFQELQTSFNAGSSSLRTIVRYLDRNPRMTETNAHIKEKTGTYTSYNAAEIKQWHKDYAGRPIVWSDMLGMIGSIDAVKQSQYKCPKCGGALIALNIVRGDLELECIHCSHRKKYYSSKPKR